VRSGSAGKAAWWFSALDQRAIDVGGARWTAQVVGIHEDRSHLWIQLESAIDGMHRVVLHVTFETSLDQALAAMAASRPAAIGPHLVHARRERVVMIAR
jgi:hypothetical protein